MSDKSRIPKFYQLSISDRVRAIAERGLLTEPDSEQLATGAHTLDASRGRSDDRECGRRDGVAPGYGP